MHNSGLLLAGAAAVLRADNLARGKDGCLVKPPAQHNAPREGGRFAGQIGKHRLRDVLGEVRVAIELAKGHRINEPEMPRNQLTKGFFVPVFCKSTQQLFVVRHFYSPLGTRRNSNPTKKSEKKASKSREAL